MSDWDVALYRRFEDERTRPAMDLLARVGAVQPASVVDLGCGPGNSTELLAERFPAASVVGVDSSLAMVEAARARMPKARFEPGDAATWAPERPVDVLFSNAVLHWVPDHARLYPRLVSLLAPGGWLAVQVPDNLHTETHTLMRKVALAGGWSNVATAAEAERTPIGSFEDHYNWLAPSCSEVEVWRTTYVHPLDGPEAIAEWFASTGLRPYLSRLPDDDARRRFTEGYRDECARAFPRQHGGKVLLRFPRLFVVARKT